ncbi:MAG: hypothetical protein KKB77_00730, partial [Bacteroidetes bacterium]|nr:hypothetical protein [Bacteroidota bacterium]
MLKKISGKNLSQISVLLLVFISFQCDFRKPIAPTWDIQVSFPLINHPYTLDSLIRKDTSIIQMNPTYGFLTYSYSNATTFDSIGDKIKLKPEAPSPFTISAGAIPVTNIPDASLYIPNRSPGIPAGPIPPGNLLPISAPLPSYDLFEYLVFESGTARLTIQNYLPIAIVFNNPVMLRDSENNIIGPFIIDTVDAGKTKSDFVSLAGKKITQTLKIDTVQLSTPGGRIDTRPDTLFKITLGLTNLTINSARVKIPPTTILQSNSSEFVVDTSANPSKIKVANFKTGKFDLRISNDLDFSAKLSLTLPQVVKKSNGQKLDTTLTISRKNDPGSTASITIDLANVYEFRSLTPTNVINYSASLDQLGSVNDGLYFRNYSSTDKVTFSLVIHQPPHDFFTVRYIEGIIKPTTITFDTTLKIKIGDLSAKFSIDSLRLPDAKFILKLKSPNIQSSVVGNLLLDSNSQYSISIPPTLLAANDTTDIELSGDNVVSTIARYISTHKNLPKSFYVNASGTINPNYISGSISNTDKIGGRIIFDVPLNVGIRGGMIRDTVEMGDAKNDDGSKFNLDSNLVNSIQSGWLNFTFKNGIPLGLKSSIILLDKNKNVLQFLPATGPVTVNPSLVRFDGFAGDAVESKFIIPLNKTEIDNINRAKFIALEIVINTVETAPFVKFKNTDWINFRVFGT